MRKNAEKNGTSVTSAATAETEDIAVNGKLRKLPELKVPNKILDEHPVQIGIFDLKGRYIYVNHAVEKDAAIRREMIGQTDIDYCRKIDLPENIGQQRFQAIQQCISENKDIVLEEKFSNGKQDKYFNRNYSPSSDENGKVQYVVSYATDITDQKRTEILLRESEERYRFLYEANPTMYFTMDTAGTVISVNQFGAEHLGYQVDELVGDSVLKIFYEADVAAVKHQFQHCLDHPGQTFQWQFRKVCKDGSLMWVEEFARAIYAPTGELMVLVVCEDINTRKHFEEKLTKNEKMLRKAQAIAHIGSFEWLIVEGIVTWSNELYRIFGLQPGEIDASPEAIIEKVHPDDRSKVMLIVTQALKSCQSFEVEARILRPDGEIRIIDTKVEIVAGDDNRAVRMVGIGQDITERVKEETRRLELEQQFQHTQKLESLGVLAGGIAHDFNNILTGILGNSGLALMDLAPDSPAYDNIRSVAKSSRRAAELCRQLLAYTGKSDLIVGAIHLNEIIEELTQLFNVSIAQKATLHYSLQPGLPLIRGDATQVHQVIMNLITNAADAIKERRGEIYVRTGSEYCSQEYLQETYLNDDLPEGQYVFVEVEDNGMGMDNETLARMFDPFFTTKFTGRGLGLAALLGIVRSHRGAVKVTSAPGKGTIFRVLFPETDETVIAAESSNTENISNATKGTILVVDDEEAVREVAEKTLVNAGFSVVLAKDGLEAIQIFREQFANIALVLLDMTMPFMNGEETYRALKRIKSEVKVVFSSGYSESRVSAKDYNSNLVTFLPKPYEPQALNEKVASLLDSK